MMSKLLLLLVLLFLSAPAVSACEYCTWKDKTKRVVMLVPRWTKLIIRDDFGVRESFCLAWNWDHTTGLREHLL